jgi:hypothetical protein
VNRILQTGPTQAEIDKNIVQTVSGVISGLESTSEQGGPAGPMGDDFRRNPGGWKESLNGLEGATPAAVQAAARKWLTRGSYTLTVLPFGDPEGVQAQPWTVRRCQRRARLQMHGFPRLTRQRRCPTA